MTKDITFTIEANKFNQLFDTVGQNMGALLDMIHAQEYGEHTAVLDYDDSGDDRIEVMYFDSCGRAAIDTNGGTIWIDANSTQDAIDAYRNDDMDGRR